MKYLIMYDISTETNEDQQRLREIAKICEGFGHRVQYSVFEAELDKSSLLLLRARLDDRLDCSRDSVDIYAIQNSPTAHQHVGVQRSFSHDQPYIL